MMQRCIVIALGLVMITSCGWRLRGSVELPSGLNSAHVTAGDREFKRDLEQVLEANGVDVVGDKALADIAILAGNLQQDRRVATTGGNTLVTEYELSYTLEYSVEDSQGNVLQPTDELFIIRTYDFNADEVVSKAQEERLLQREMRGDLAQQLVRRLRFMQPSATDPDNAATAQPHN